MSNAILTRTISAVADRRLSLGGGQARRRPEYLSTWNKVRFGIRLSFNGSANLTGTPQIFFGMCAGIGITGGYANATTGNCLGVAAFTSTWTYAGSPAYYGSITLKTRKRIGSTLTDGSSGTSFYFTGNPATMRSLMVVEITKGSPNFNIEVVAPTTTGSAQVDATDLNLVSMMEASTMSGAAAVLSGYGTSGPLAVAMDEATNGFLDCFNLYWDRATVPLEVSEIRHRRIS